MTVDWNAVAALGGWVAAIVAFGAYLLQRRQMSFSANLDSLWRLDDRFNDAAMVQKRSVVARRLLDHDTKEDRDTEDVLDYFDMVGYLIDRKALDRETAWMMFSDAALSYWFGAQAYLDANAKGTPYWGDFRSLIAEVFLPIEMRKGKLDAQEARKRAAKRSVEFLKCELEMAPGDLKARPVISSSTGRAKLGRAQPVKQSHAVDTVAP